MHFSTCVFVHSTFTKGVRLHKNSCSSNFWPGSCRTCSYGRGILYGQRQYCKRWRTRDGGLSLEDGLGLHHIIFSLVAGCEDKLIADCFCRQKIELDVANKCQTDRGISIHQRPLQSFCAAGRIRFQYYQLLTTFVSQLIFMLTSRSAVYPDELPQIGNEILWTITAQRCVKYL